jgi:hypothetical protein
MKKIKLSNIPGDAKRWTYEQMIDFLLDQNADTIVNDIPPVPHIEYDLADLEVVWESLRKLF